MSQRCELCGDAYHAEPDPEPGWADLICPGANASEDDKWAYRLALTQAFAAEIYEQTQRANVLIERKQLWYQRERADVSHSELQADCDQRVPQVQKEIDHAVASARNTLDVDPPHFTVQAPAPIGGRIRTSSVKDKTRPDDAMLFVNPPSPPPHVNDQAPHSRPGDKDYW